MSKPWRRKLHRMRSANSYMPEKAESLKHNPEHRARLRWKREHRRKS